MTKPTTTHFEFADRLLCVLRRTVTFVAVWVFILAVGVSQRSVVTYLPGTPALNSLARGYLSLPTLSIAAYIAVSFVFALLAVWPLPWHKGYHR